MIKKTLRNYLSNLKFIFTPIGILTIFVLIGTSIALTNAYHAVTNMFTEIGKTVSASDMNVTAGIKAGFNRIVSADWNNLKESLKQVFSGDWLLETLKEMVKAAFPEAGDIMSQVQEQLKNCIRLIVVNFVLIIIFMVIGIVVGYVVLKIFITRQTVKRKFGKAVLKSLLHAFMNLLIIAFAIFILSLLKLPLWANLLITFVLFFIVNLFESYLIFGLKKLPFKTFINWKNILFVILSSLIVMVITATLCTGFYFIFRLITALVLINGAIQVGVATNELLGESYINYLLEQNAPPVADTPETSEVEPSSNEEDDDK